MAAGRDSAAPGPRTREPRKLDAVFDRGGVKGIGMVGAISVIEREGYEFVNLAGLSTGAMIATLLGAGYTAAELKEIIMELDLRHFRDAGPVGRLPGIGPLINVLTRSGLYRGDAIRRVMRELLEAKGVRTFGDLILPELADEPRYRYRVQVVAADITRGRLLLLPEDARIYGIEPNDLEVALAVRMSVGIPFFFQPVRLRNPGGETSYIVDGGLMSDFPLGLFDAPGEPEWPTFGFRLVRTRVPPVVRHRVNGPVSLLLAVYGTAISAQEARYIETHDTARTIMIDALDVGGIQFDVSRAHKEALFESGVAAAEAFLAGWDFERYKTLFRSNDSKPEQPASSPRG